MGAARGATAALILITAAAMAGCAHSDEGPSSDEAVRPAATQANSDVSNLGVGCDAALANRMVKPATVAAVTGWKGKTVTVCLMDSDGKVNESMQQTFNGDDDIKDVIWGNAETAQDRPATCHPKKDQWTMIIDQSGKAWRLTPLDCVTTPGGSLTPSEEKTSS
ncbi:transcriptional regulator [Cutibacterium sp. V970]|uniref:transcriptional regulator n=1 Tax=Cutibacterium sp. V970 TaxID=3446481 RepID=UPI003EE126CD